MCLTKVDEEPKQYKRKAGYKVVCVDDKGRLSPEFGNFDLRYPIGRWLDDPWSGALLSEVVQPGPTKTDYPTGFHIFMSLKAAKLWRQASPVYQIRKVDFDGVVATGTQEIGRGMRNYTVRVIVATKMRVRRGAIKEDNQ